MDPSFVSRKTAFKLVDLALTPEGRAGTRASTRTTCAILPSVTDYLLVRRGNRGGEPVSRRGSPLFIPEYEPPSPSAMFETGL